jgi:Tol biopolymer transport system component/DNA-binding winged helix-turn-helix (wHTH) protein
VTDHKSFVFRFGEFEVKEREFLLIKAGRAVPVEPKAFRVLLFLLRNPGRLVKKDEILNAVWDDCSVSDNSLTRSIATLRRLLGDDPHEPHYIATVQTVGYRFLCEVVATEDFAANGTGSPRLIPPVDNGSARRETEGQGFGIGRKIPSRLLIAGIGLALLVILVSGFLLRGVLRGAAHTSGPSVAGAKSPGVRLALLTSVPGEVREPAFSPDGQKIAFFWDEEKPTQSDLYMQLVGVGEKPLRLTHTASGFLCCASWSPDGRRIAFSRCDDNGGGIYVVPALGGSERKITDVACLLGFDGYPVWTPDGASLLLADRCVSDGSRGIVEFSLSTGERQCLTAPPPLGDYGDTALALSPDGKTLAFIRSSTLQRDEIYTIDLAGSHLRQLTHDGNSIGGPLMWAPDGQHVIFSSTRDGSWRPWRVPVAGGAIEQETVYPRVGSLSRDGRRLAYVEGPGCSPSIWRARLDGPGGKILSVERILASSSGEDSAQLSSDGQQVVFRSGRVGTGDLWKSDVNGDDPLQLTRTSSGFAGTPRWSPDGKWIVFDYRITTHSQIYVVDAEGRNLRAVTGGDWENEVPSWSRDGASIYFASNRTGSWQVWKRKVATGEERQVTRNGGHAAFESYDAKVLYFSKFDGAGIWSIPVAGGAEQRVTDALHRGYWGHFTVTDGGIYLLDAEATPRPTVMYYSFQTKRLTPVFQIPEHPLPWVSNLSASGDGRTLLFAQQIPKSSIMMVDNLQ